MGYNCVRVGDDIIRKKKSDVIHNLGELDWKIYEPNTGLIVKKIENAKESALLVLKILTVNDRKDYKNSVITGWKITERRLNNYLRNKEIIYRKE